MITKELLNQFIIEWGRYSEPITIQSYEVYSNCIYVKFIINNSVIQFPSGEIILLDKWDKWYLNKLKEDRQEKLNELGI